MKTQFKWNPFTLFGDSPSSLRFKSKPEEGDLEFATKEDLEAIKADPKLSKIYQAMQAGVTKKFQGWGEEKKTLSQQVTTLQNQINELDSGLLEWENWFADNKDTLTQALTGGGRKREEGKGQKKSEEPPPDERYNQLVEGMNKAAQTIENKLKHMGRMLQLSLELNDLYRQNPQLDGNKVLDVALKKGYQRLTDAYKDEDAYGKELFDKEVEVRLKPRLEEELNKQKTAVETGSGAVPVGPFQMPKDISKSFTGAGQEFLTERAKESAGLGGSESQKK